VRAYLGDPVGGHSAPADLISFTPPWPKRGKKHRDLQGTTSAHLLQNGILPEVWARIPLKFHLERLL
jgi:hypothetical protein